MELLTTFRAAEQGPLPEAMLKFYRGPPMTLGSAAAAKVRLVIRCKSCGRRTAALLLTNATAQLAGTGGIFGERRLSPPSCTHGCALSQKISLSGLTQLASSSVPAMIIVTFGMISASSISGDPHSGQKRR